MTGMDAMQHLSAGVLERFQQERGSSSEGREIYKHAKACDVCRQRIVDVRGEASILRALIQQLLPDEETEPFHLEFEMIEGYVDNTLDQRDMELAEMHLADCAKCSWEVDDLRESLATMGAVSPPQIGLAKKRALQDRSRLFQLLPHVLYPLHVPAIVGLVVLAIVAAAVFWRMKSATEQAQRNSNMPNNKAIAQSKPAPGPPSPKSPANSVQSPSASAKSPRTVGSRTSPRENTDHQQIVLNDGASRVTLDEHGNVTGLTDVPDNTRHAVRDVLATNIKKPEILSELAGTEGVLRGNSDQTIKLLSPGDSVVAEDRPLFRWLPLKDIGGYRVRVGDATFHAAAESEDLPSTTTEWRPTTALKRGMTYTWTVIAIRSEGENSEPSSAREIKFKVLSAEKLQELDNLKTRSQSHLSLGVFYAREGMVDEAEREFQALVQQNPRSPIAIKLLKEVASWRER